MKQRTDIERQFNILKDKGLEQPGFLVLIVTCCMFNSVFLYTTWNIYFSFATPSLLYKARDSIFGSSILILSPLDKKVIY